jgi:alkanesulfonate monooxygenase SsuD/methylene tetrahydromethanopterin reductase-like flavin-dependent oxidoreductase (luciferase family)
VSAVKFAAYAMPSFQPSFGLSRGEFLRATIDQLASAEPLGYDSLWVNEHHFHQYGGLMPSLPTMLAALSQRTSRVHLGTSVVLLPLHHPLDIAEQLAMVDLMSGGRLEFGIGRGFVAHDYEVMGLPNEGAQDRMIEALDVVVKAWSGAPFDHHGTYYDFDNVNFWPAPEQEPHPPIWIACSNTPASFEWVGTQGHRLLTIGYLRPISALAELTRIYRDAWQANGHQGPTTIGTHYHVVVAEKRADARRIAEGALREHVRLNRLAQSVGKSPPPAANEGISIEQLVDEGRLIAGSPDDCAKTLRRVAEEIGCTEAHCLFQFGDIPFDVAQRSIDLFAREVIPQLREVSVGV